MNIFMIAAAVFAAAAAGAVVWALRQRDRAVQAEAKVEALQAQGEMLKAQVTQSATGVAEAILKRNEGAVVGRERLAQAQLEAQLKPVAESLQKFQEHVALVEKARAEETGSLKEQIAQMLAASVATQDEARKLSAALRRGAGVQGRWGEQTLRNVLEAAGLSNRYDFNEQTTTDTEEGRRRPDVTVKLPGGGVFVIGAKCSLNDFLEQQDAVDALARDAAMARHASSV